MKEVVSYHIGELVSRTCDFKHMAATAETATLRGSYHDAAECFQRAIDCYQRGYEGLARIAVTQAYNAIGISRLTNDLELEAERRKERAAQVKPTNLGLFSIFKTD